MAQVRAFSNLFSATRMAAAVRKSRTYGLETRAIIRAMKLQLAALIATSVIAIVAAVFAILPVVGDAPWEDDAPVAAQPVDRTQEIRCEGALSFRDTALIAVSELNTRTMKDQLDKAQREVDRYC